MAEGSLAAVQDLLIRCISVARRYMYLDMKVRLSRLSLVSSRWTKWSHTSAIVIGSWHRGGGRDSNSRPLPWQRSGI